MKQQIVRHKRSFSRKYPNTGYINNFNIFMTQLYNIESKTSTFTFMFRLLLVFISKCYQSNTPKIRPQ